MIIMSFNVVEMQLQCLSVSFHLGYWIVQWQRGDLDTDTAP